MAASPIARSGVVEHFLANVRYLADRGFCVRATSREIDIAPTGAVDGDNPRGSSCRVDYASPCRTLIEHVETSVATARKWRKEETVASTYDEQRIQPPKGEPKLYILHLFFDVLGDALKSGATFRAYRGTCEYRLELSCLPSPFSAGLRSVAEAGTDIRAVAAALIMTLQQTTASRVAELERRAGDYAWGWHDRDTDIKASNGMDPDPTQLFLFDVTADTRDDLPQSEPEAKLKSEPKLEDKQGE